MVGADPDLKRDENFDIFLFFQFKIYFISKINTKKSNIFNVDFVK